MICVKCSAEIPDGSVYCCQCGRKQIRETHKGSRANGLGSVYYDARAGRWVAQIVASRYRTPDKKLRYKYARKYFKTRTAALKAVQTMSAESAKKPDFTLSYYYDAFTSGRGANLSHDKSVAYRIAYNRMKKIHETRVSDLTISDLQQVVNETTSTYYPARDIRALLNAIFKLAHADNSSINPVLPHLLELPPLEEESPDPLTVEEQLLLWYSYDAGNLNAAIPLIMIYTGLMTGEVMKLKKSMISLETKEIVGVGIKTKTRKEKTVLLPDDIIPVLEDVISRASKDKIFAVNKDRFYQIFYQALKDAGIERHITPYSCRHTTATVLAVHDHVAPQVLQRVMRWKSTKMMDKYVNPQDEDARRAVNCI